MKFGPIAACLLAAFPVVALAAAAEPTWDEVVNAANAEGEVDVHGAPGRLYEQLLTEKFKAAYPAIKLNFSGSSGRDAIPQIMREREAGVYHWDVYVGGTPSILQNLKPAGAFAPLKGALVRPDIVADKGWRGGFDAGWMDKEKQFTYGFDFTIDPVVLVNRDFVAPADLKTFADLLKPQFADKLVWDDPRLPGAGPLVGQNIVLNFGVDFLVQLLTKQKIVYTTNRRQNAEWVVRGRYPIGLGTGFDDLAIFQQQGLGGNVKAFSGDETKFMGGPGFGTVSLMDRAPHPMAAKVYINWLLSSEGQGEWNKSQRNSRRLDVTPGAPEFMPQAGIAYIDSQSEQEIPSRELVQTLARKYLGERQP